MSARIIGREFGMNAPEMNKMLAQYGYLEGAPGLWRLTPKGEQYAHEQHEHRGTGGYASMNREWTVTTYDDTIIDALKSDIEANPNPPDLVFTYPAGYGPDETAEDEPTTPQQGQPRDGLSDAQKLLLILTALAGTAYGVKKLYPHAKRRWEARKERRAARKAGEPGPED